MKRLLLTSFFLVLALTLGGCLKKKTPVAPEAYPVFMFQNGVGLSFGQAGCSLMDLGGIGRLCKKRELTPTDLFLQVGPAFSFLIPPTEEVSEQKVSEWRKKLLGVWELTGVSLYAVDSKDLEPSLARFQSDLEGHKIPVISTNLRNHQGKTPFQTFQRIQIKNRAFLFLSFSEPGKIGSDWNAIGFKEALTAVSSELQNLGNTQLVVLGNLNSDQRKELALLINKPVAFLGGPLQEMNPTEWIAVSETAWWAKAADLGRGVGLIYWDSAANSNGMGKFIAQGLGKELDASNQCTDLLNK